MNIQAIWFYKKKYTPISSLQWLIKNDIKPIKSIHYGKKFYKYRINKPQKGKKYYSKYIMPGVLFIFQEFEDALDHN
jgi:hypothetical protein